MRFMMMIKSDEQSEAGVLPDEKLITEMGKYNDDLVKAGALLAAEGLQPTSKGARVKFSRGRPAVIDGPFAEAKEVIAGYWLIEARSKQEAIEWAKRVPFEAGETPANSGGVGEVEVRQVFELEDFPVSENESGWREAEASFRAQDRALQAAPSGSGGASLKRFMIIRKADKDTEAGVMPTEDLLAAMGAYNAEMINAGVLLSGEGLQPSSKGARVYYSAGKRTLVDGPFTETKELIAGYTLIQVKTREEALEWAMRFPAPHGEHEECHIEIRQLYELEDFGAIEGIERFRDLGISSEK
jgi:hypothetical protein